MCEFITQGVLEDMDRGGVNLRTLGLQQLVLVPGARTLSDSGGPYEDERQKGRRHGLLQEVRSPCVVSVILDENSLKIQFERPICTSLIGLISIDIAERMIFSQ